MPEALWRPGAPLTDGVVVLRDLREDDVPAIVEGCRDPLVRRFTARIPDPYREEDAREFIALQPQMVAEGRETHFAIAGAEDDALLGVIGLHHVDRPTGSALCGYWVGPRHRGRGVATRALRLLVAWATGELGIEGLRLFAHVENVGSHRVAEQAGFRRTGVTKHAFAGCEGDAFAYELAPSAQ